MDATPAAAPLTSGVRVFTVLVLSGSLFLLIYNVGRRRMSTRSSLSAPSTEGSSRGYFSHLKDKPLAPHRNPSLLLALESSALGREEGEQEGTRDQAGTSSCGAIGSELGESPYGESYDGDAGRNDAERGPGIHEEASWGCADDSGNGGPALGHEGHMIEHMKRDCPFGEAMGCRYNDEFGPARRRSSSSYIGDMFQLETEGFGMEDRIVSQRLRTPINTDFQTFLMQQPRFCYAQALSRTLREQVLKPLLYIFIWFVLKYSFHVYSTTGWGAKMTRFPAPFLKTTIHFAMQTVISICMLRWPMNRVFAMPWSKYLLTVAPIATATALDRDFQDASVFLIALAVPMLQRPSGPFEHAYMVVSSLKDASLETAWDAKIQSKGYVPLCLFIFALAFRLESRSVSIVVSIAIIGVGFILAVTKGTKFGVMSLKESSTGPFLSGFRWAATQSLLQKRELGMITPVVTMRALSPSVAMITALFSLMTEPLGTLHTTEFFDIREHALKSSAHLLVWALLATALGLAELVVIYHTSALTLIVLGMLKDLCVVATNMAQDQDFSEQNMLGIVIFGVGLVCLILLKYQQLLRRIWPHAAKEGLQLKIVFAFLTSRFSPVMTGGIPSLSSRLDQARQWFERMKDAPGRVSRKLRALWELAT